MKRTQPAVHYDWPLTVARIEQMTPGMARHWLRQLELIKGLLPPVKSRPGRIGDPRIASEDPYLDLRLLLAMSETDLQAKMAGRQN